MRVPKGHLKFLIPVSFFNILLWHVFSAWGISLLESGQASIIAYTMPLWAVIFSIILNKEKPHLQNENPENLPNQAPTQRRRFR